MTALSMWYLPYFTLLYLTLPYLTLITDLVTEAEAAQFPEVT